MIEPWKRENCP